MLPVSRLKKLTMLTERAPKTKGGVKKPCQSACCALNIQFHDTYFTKEALIYSIFRPCNALEALIYLGATAGF
ncbi:hypothetical protein [Pseudomonas cannabina]|uniref:hypothetical protein n=1 Tax=Pseudomonas cannabina TaxID=86840 RepID=UPI0006D5D668|nr:hypothetical protein [Pseudomonas cannabina]